MLSPSLIFSSRENKFKICLNLKSPFCVIGKVFCPTNFLQVLHLKKFSKCWTMINTCSFSEGSMWQKHIQIFEFGIKNKPQSPLIKYFFKIPNKNLVFLQAYIFHIKLLNGFAKTRTKKSIINSMVSHFTIK